ncbi:hypothetical protein FKM82_028389, partial [Ascaphus truei]
AAGGEIFNQCVADRDEAFTEKDVTRLIRQILQGVLYLHRSNVVHLDLKPQNILLTSSSPLGDIRIVDFGLSRQVDGIKEVREILGTPEYVGKCRSAQRTSAAQVGRSRTTGVLMAVTWLR